MESSSSFPSVAILILCWNGKKFLELFLPSVLSSTYPNLEVYIADNASTDDTLLFLQQTYSQVKIISFTQNFGFAKGYNSAISNIREEYIILLNQDVEVVPGWIEPIVDLMSKDNRIAACQPKVLSYSNRNYFEYAGGAGGFMDKYGYTFCRGRIFYTLEVDMGQYEMNQDIFWGSGAALFLRTRIFLDIGGFYEEFFAHMEEIDLCWRFHRKGFRVLYCADSKIYHVGGGSLPQGNPAKAYLNYRNNLIMMARNLGPILRIIRIVPRLGMDLISIVNGLYHGNFGEVKAILAAHFAFFQWYLRNSRKLPKSAPSPENWPGVYPGSLIWAYFIKKVRYFGDLVWKKR